jgi:hypothetical protein
LGEQIEMGAHNWVGRMNEWVSVLAAHLLFFGAFVGDIWGGWILSANFD